VGSQIFEKAIERAVESDKLERFPLEMAQVENIIKQSIDALPQIVEWKNLNDNVKNAFLGNHVKRLMANVGVEGWAHTALEGIFDAEVNKRILAAAIADEKKLLKKLDTKNRHLRYTSTVLEAVGESLTKPSPNMASKLAL